VIGKVDSLWKYPVKSLVGEKIETVVLNDRGLDGDRIYAVSSTKGKLGSGKNTRRFTRIDGLFAMSARTTKSGVSIKFPNGNELADDDPALNDQLSQLLGQDVKLTKEDNISHFDQGAIHILTTKTLLSLQNLLPDSHISASRFRPNIVIDSSHEAAALIGKTLKIGEVRLKVIQETERCRMITLSQSDLDYSPEILKTISKSYSLNFGVYAQIISTGDISIGNEVQHVQG